MVRTEPVRETLFGVFYVLQEVNKLQRDSVVGFSVGPLKDIRIPRLIGRIGARQSLQMWILFDLSEQ